MVLPTDPATRPGDPTTMGSAALGEGLYRFLSCSHMFGSLLRELLDNCFLTDPEIPRLTRAQFCMLKLITVSADLQVGEIARYLSVTPAAASKSLDKLERLELVCRSPSTEDRRATLVSASGAGRRLVDRYEQLKASWLEPAVGALDEYDLDRLCSLLERVCVDLVRSGPEFRGPCLRCAGYFRSDCSLSAMKGDCALKSARRESV